jgi:formylglycine-generating enzyme required for sulfatase activity
LSALDAIPSIHYSSYVPPASKPGGERGWFMLRVLPKSVGGWVSVLILPISVHAGGAAARGDVFNLPSGQTSLSLVTIGDPGNAADPATGYGAVGYTFQMSTYDTTVAQYCAFLNAVATTADPYGLYNSSMNPGNDPSSCGIIQMGAPGAFSYTYVGGRQNFPVNAVSWGDAARFCNWLANGQPTTGVENSTTTEDGSYALNGALTDQALNLVTRSPNATYVIPTENEWYKSAYGAPDGVFTLFPTASNTAPSNVLSPTESNNANFLDPVLGFTDPVNFLTPVGAFADSPSAFGTYDQGGDVYNWDEALTGGPGRQIRGGDYAGEVAGLESDSSNSIPSSGESISVGFRIAEVPEPSSIALLAAAACGLLARRRSRVGTERGMR